MLKDPFSSKLLEPRHKQGEIDEFCGMLNPSGYNPPPYYRRLMGDFYYISIKTLEDCDYHVTANPEGFFVNCSTSSHFNPTSNSKYAVCNSLFELLNQLSPRFRTRFKEVIDGIKINDFQKMLMSSLCPTQSREWLRRTCTRVHLWRNESLETKEKKYDFSTIKDWNEIFQIQKVLPTDSLYDKIGKEKLKFKVYY